MMFYGLILNYTPMSTFSDQLKSEMIRIVKKEIRAESKTRKNLGMQQRAEIAALKRRVAELETALKRLGQTGARSAPAAAPSAPEGGVKLRFRAGGFASLRQKLDLTAAQMAQLLGVSPQSVYHWEIGKSRPRASQLPAISAVRKLGKKQVLARLAG
jgi:DNA-binding XRE family transcriptional regulator